MMAGYNTIVERIFIDFSFQFRGRLISRILIVVKLGSDFISKKESEMLLRSASTCHKVLTSSLFLMYNAGDVVAQ